MSNQFTTESRRSVLFLTAVLAIFWQLPSTVFADNVYSDKVYKAEDVYIAEDNEYESYDEATADIVILSPDILADLVGPIALYPDDLLAIVLPASTYPLQIVQAARFLDDYENDSSLQPPEDWDESVTALLNYPEVIRLMSDDLTWTWELGGAVLNQQQDVIVAMETFRDRAYAAGNLRSDEYQTVDNDGDSIEITPVNEEVIYVPYYEPRRVVVRHVEPAYYYYPRPYPVYYYPYPENYAFSNGFFWGVTTAFRIGWSTHNLHVRHHSFRSHPYYGQRYSGHYYRQPSIQIFNNWYVNNSGRHSNNRYRDGDRWRPRPNNGARPNGHIVNQRDRNRRDTSVSREGFASERTNLRGRDRGNLSGAVNRRATANQRPVVRESVRNASTTTRRPLALEGNDLRKRPVAAGSRPGNRTDRTASNRTNTLAGAQSDLTRRPAVSRQPVREPIQRNSNRRRVSSERAVTSKPVTRRAAPSESKPAIRRGAPSQAKPVVRRTTTTQSKPAARRIAPSKPKPVRQNKPAQQKEPRRADSSANRKPKEAKAARNKEQKRPAIKRKSKQRN